MVGASIAGEAGIAVPTVRRHRERTRMAASGRRPRRRGPSRRPGPALGGRRLVSESSAEDRRGVDLDGGRGGAKGAFMFFGGLAAGSGVCDIRHVDGFLDRGLLTVLGFQPRAGGLFLQEPSGDANHRAALGLIWQPLARSQRSTQAYQSSRSFIERIAPWPPFGGVHACHVRCGIWEPRASNYTR